MILFFVSPGFCATKYAFIEVYEYVVAFWASWEYSFTVWAFFIVWFYSFFAEWASKYNVFHFLWRYFCKTHASEKILKFRHVTTIKIDVGTVRYVFPILSVKSID